MIYSKPDGEIEILSSGCCCPPGARRAGQHTNSSTHWYRAHRWEAWTRCRSETAARILAGAAETCEEFELAMLEAEVVPPPESR